LLYTHTHTHTHTHTSISDMALPLSLFASHSLLSYSLSHSNFHSPFLSLPLFVRVLVSLFFHLSLSHTCTHIHTLFLSMFVSVYSIASMMPFTYWMPKGWCARVMPMCTSLRDSGMLPHTDIAACSRKSGWIHCCDTVVNKIIIYTTIHCHKKEHYEQFVLRLFILNDRLKGTFWWNPRFECFSLLNLCWIERITVLRTLRCQSQFCAGILTLILLAYGIERMSPKLCPEYHKFGMPIDVIITYKLLIIQKLSSKDIARVIAVQLFVD
jgi:hypothetical protein